MASKQDVGNVRQEHYYAVMYWMSEDSKRQWTHRMDRTLQRNLGLSFYSWTCAKMGQYRTNPLLDTDSTCHSYCFLSQKVTY